MAEYEVGYGKPPKHCRFKPGVSANPKGRPKRKPLAIAEIIARVLNETTVYRERGRIRTAKRQELTLKTFINRALKGDVKAADVLLKIRAHARKYGNAGGQKIRVKNWLPDYPGQTAEQKTREFATEAEATQPSWWKQTGQDPAGGS